MKRWVLVASAIFDLSLATSASAATFEFGPTSFAGGGLLVGRFSGNDDDGNGVISSFDPGNEITGFTASFVGDGTVVDWTAGRAELQSLVYRPAGGPTLGDDVVPSGEGLWVRIGSKHLLAGLGAYGEPGAIVTDLAVDATSIGAAPIAGVPEPASSAPFCAALVGLSQLARRRAARSRSRCPRG